MAPCILAVCRQPGERTCPDPNAQSRSTRLDCVVDSLYKLLCRTQTPPAAAPDDGGGVGCVSARVPPKVSIYSTGPTVF